MNILSLGAGVQSTTVFLMSCLGILPKLDHAIFADTQWEPKEVYDNLEWLAELGKQYGIPVHKITYGSLRDDSLNQDFNKLPLFVKNREGTVGMLRRQCTSNYKIRPIEKFIVREILGKKSARSIPEGFVNQWFGISSDEVHRVNPSRSKWKIHTYPLVGLPNDMLPAAYSRQQCLDWLAKNYPGRNIPRSSCLGCPFHSNEEWEKLRQNNQYWEDIVGFDNNIRIKNRLRLRSYLHRKAIPIQDVALSVEEEKDQLILWGNECDGYCNL